MTKRRNIMLDGRSTYAKVLKVMDELTKIYDYEHVIPYEDIEYAILSLCGYYDKRTYEKFFQIMEKAFLLKRTPNAHRVSTKKTVTKQKTDRLSFQTFRGHPYCWSHYVLGRTPLKPSSPQSPPRDALMT
jgi:hypothetical protein